MHVIRMHPKGASSWRRVFRFVFLFSWRTLRFAPRLVNRTFGAGCAQHPKGAGAHIACTPKVCTHKARTRAHARGVHDDFDTITWTCRSERAVIFFRAPRRVR